MYTNRNAILLLFFLALACLSASAQSSKELKLAHKVSKRLKDYPQYFIKQEHLGKIVLDSVHLSAKSKQIQLYFNNIVSYQPIRESSIQLLQGRIRKDLGRTFRRYSVQLYSNAKPLEHYIPNAYRMQVPTDASRQGVFTNTIPLVRNTAQPIFQNGLQNNHIALWHSHGWYYEGKLDRWEWQRPRLFGSVEDMGTMAYVVPYLVPMLENAGANVLLPRERDTQVEQAVVDNDGSEQGFVRQHAGRYKWQTQGMGSGYALMDTLYNNDNPFTRGTSQIITASTTDTARLVYLPTIPATGMYAVSVSWVSVPESVTAAYYTVYHAGGSTRFSVNQRMGGGTWQYLGHFKFYKGRHYEEGRVELSNQTEAHGMVTADAVRFGGGMGKVARRLGDAYEKNQWSLAGGKKPNEKVDTSSNAMQEAMQASTLQWKLSGRPAYNEAARYYLQGAGVPASVYSLTDGKNDYNDDYQSRGEWVNYLLGQHIATNDSIRQGLNIPVDLAFAFHTDAGVTPNDSVIGTLAIYNTVQAGEWFANGQSKMASRDLCDLIQSRIVNDVRAQFNPNWIRRAMWDKPYSEAWRPQVPTMLLELLSHQNQADMRYSLDPRFRFAVSRAIYKGMLDFLYAQQGPESVGSYVVQPLSPSLLSMQVISPGRIRLTWQAREDALEPSAQATQFRVYTRIGDGGFDNGVLTTNTSMMMVLSKPGVTYSFKVAAVNEGGQSMDSEVLAACLQNTNTKPVLVVNGFNRVSGPKWMDTGKLAGMASCDDEGVPYRYELAQVGMQYDYDRSSAWLDDDSPGWGASHADMEGKLIPGNTFDFTYTHGTAIAQAGHSFISISREAFEQQTPDPSKYLALDMIMGEQRSMPQYLDSSKRDFEVFTPTLIQAMEQFTQAGSGIILSGAYIGTDMVEHKDSLAMRFAKERLHYIWRTNHADKLGLVNKTDAAPMAFPSSLAFNTAYKPSIYKVEAPDAIEPAGKHAATLFRYGSNNTSAGVIYKDAYTAISLGFPFETIVDEYERNELMKAMLGVIVK